MTLLAGLGLIISILYLKQTLFATLFIIGILAYIVWKKDNNAKRITIVALIIGGGLLAVLIFVEHIEIIPRSGIVTRRSENYFVLSTLCGRFYISEHAHAHEVGDILSFSATGRDLQFYKLEQQFDFGNYLQNLGITKQLLLKDVSYVWRVPIRSSAIIKHLLIKYSDQEKELIASLLFNQRDYESQIFKHVETMQIVYLLGASGLHINALIRLNKKVSKYFRLSPAITEIISLAPLVIFFIFIPSHFAIYRIALTNVFKMINEYKIRHKVNYLTVVIFSAFTFLIINPYLAFQPTYFLSYGLIIFFTLSRATLQNKKAFLRPIMGAICAYALMLPYVIFQGYYLHIFSFVFIFILAPLLSFTFIIGWFSILIPPLTGVISFCYRVNMSMLNIFSKIDIKIPLGKPSILWILFFYALLFILMFALTIHHRPIIEISVVIFTLLIGLPFFNLESYIVSSIYFINVGQGDAILLRNQRHAVLVDTGGSLYSDIAKETLIPFFASIQLYKLDAVWISHEDYDHSGALASLLEDFPIDVILRNESSWSINSWNLENLNVQIEATNNDRNDQSAVIYTEMLGQKILLMGDASVSVEEEIISENPSLDVDVLKLGHHGSKTSTSDAFIEQITPKLAIISVGRNNYGHPDETVIERLNAFDIPYLRTDQVGTILLTGWNNVCYNVTSKKLL